LVAATLKIGESAAAAYCDSQLESLAAEGPGVTKDWLRRMPRALTTLALESGNGADHV